MGTHAKREREHVRVRACVSVSVYKHTWDTCMSGCIVLNMDIFLKKHVAFGIPTVQPFDPELGHLVMNMVIKIKSP